MEGLFIELLQVAIGSRMKISRVPTEAEWSELYNMATKLSLLGVCVVALQRLKSSGALEIPETLYQKWLGMAAKIQQRNQVVNSACAELIRQYTHDGLACCILKGQGNLVNYPEDLREARTPGDIDVWCVPQDPCGLDIAVSDLDGKGAHYEKYHGKQAVIEYVKMLHRLRHDDDNDNYEVRYHHIDAPSVGGVDVEVHFRPLFLDSPLRNWRLQRWFQENEQFGVHDVKIGEHVFPIPTASFNAVYQLVHIYRHLFDEGVGLRQLLDYYFVLRALHIEQGSFADRTQSIAQWAEGMGVAVKSNEEIMHVLSLFGMKKFASAVMYVLQTVFAMPDEYLLCPPNEEEGRFLLNEIMLAGNFGQYDPRIIHNSQSIIHNWEKLKHNSRLLWHYPEQVLWEPLFRVYHWIWRRFELWRY